jgi:deoxyribonuclease-1
MKRHLWIGWIIAGLALAATPVLAQYDWNTVSLSDSVVSFGTVYTDQTDSILVTLTNNLPIDVGVTGAAFEEDAFTTDLGGEAIPALGTLNFHIYCRAVQNIDYADFLRIELDRGIRPLVVEVTAEAYYPESYYAHTRNLWGEELKDTLTAIIDGHTALGYTLARDHMYGDVDNVDGWVTCVYTGRSAFFSTRAGATANGFNCEHTWPQGFSNEAEPMRSDLFHLYPTDETANNKRGSYDFGIVVTPSWHSGGSKLGTDSEGQTVFEPRDVHKGNVARTHFYYIIRYDGNYNGYEDATKMEALFRIWNVTDPVDDAERQRNEDICALQHNRNPFIDHPGLADRISSFFGTAVHDLAPEIAVAPLSRDMGGVDFEASVHTYIAVVNTGTDTLHVSSISSTDPDFEVGLASMCLAPETYGYVGVSYTAGEAETRDSTEIVIASDDSDESSVAVPISVEVGDVSGVVDGGVARRGIVLYPNSPNPFGRRTEIAFLLDRTARVDLSIYDVKGRLADRIIDGEILPPGRHSVEFVPGGLSSGIYYCRLEVGGTVLSRPVLFLR